ncbi:phospho-N-acetylmuramoyl-pentapeptide-transferase [Schinkia azotoformans LMG 9581]|uniref:Phospho-N-acetylmuramoyl-pentapeptide-transferase n=1 Tax=Schinkia azotoformans LMG 9581 TaxID=1131731 RepID=K6DIV0_SCHAZ|nr:phospho-N-acetylmuramoyl-pentapeptide-transferase [Schinkia azotoformans LMG 9581]
MASIVLTILLPFAVIAYTQHYYQVFLFILICMGAILGFLLFNINPAHVFMGDTGSHSLGGLLAGLAFVTKTEILFILMGGVVFIETLTAIIQLISMKLRKKRVFLMTPIHHTFKLMGWLETKIVKMFWLINFSLSFLSILLLF